MSGKQKGNWIFSLLVLLHLSTKLLHYTTEVGVDNGDQYFSELLIWKQLTPLRIDAIISEWLLLITSAS